jgi:DNA (cytosine-5)-methyltransferase 1
MMRAGTIFSGIGAPECAAPGIDWRWAAEIDPFASAVAIAFGGNNTAGPIDVATACNAHGGPHGRCDFESETFVAHSLRADGFDASEDGTGRGTPLVPVMTLAIRGRGDSHDLEYRDDGIANAVLTPNGGRAGIGVGAVAFDTTQITSPGNYSVPHPGDPCHPLASRQHPPAVAFDPTARQPEWSLDRPLKTDGPLAVAFKTDQEPEAHGDICPTLQKPSPSGGGQPTAVMTGMSVRRLIPRECERLQGFPDGWTDVPYRSKPAADGPRYRAVGNSMAVPVIGWVLARVQQIAAASLEDAA